MTALATSSDVEAALGRTLTAEESARVANLLTLASASVSNEAGYRFAPGEYAIERTVRSRKVKLPADVASVESVTAVDECTGAETVVTTYTLRGSTLHGLTACRVAIEFTVEADVPGEIVAMVAGIVASSITSAPLANVASETAGPFSVSYVDSTGRVFLSKSDKLILKPYKQPKPALRLV